MTFRQYLKQLNAAEMALLLSALFKAGITEPDDIHRWLNEEAHGHICAGKDGSPQWTWSDFGTSCSIN